MPSRKSTTPNPRFDDSDTARRSPHEVHHPGGLVIFLAQTNDAVDTDASGQVTIFSGPLGSETAGGVIKTAYNRGPALNAEAWVELRRRGGGWEMFPIGYPTVHQVSFVIDSITDGEATCTVVLSLCGSATIPEMDSNGKIIVFDTLGCLFDEEEEALEGRRGFASYMSNFHTAGEEDEIYCAWVCTGLCCPPPPE